jgi:hypothetical protein
LTASKLLGIRAPLDTFSFWKSAFVTIAFSLGIFLFCSYVGKAVDCKPNQIDGLCGMSSFFGHFVGVRVAVITFLIGAVYTVVMEILKRSRTRKSEMSPP